jgi:signal transduction histidine kinase
MKYYTFWSIFDAPTNSLKPATVLLVLSFLTIIIWMLVKKFKEDKKNLEKPLLLWSTGIIFFFLLTGFIDLRFFTVDDTNERLTKFLQSSRVAIVEGKISNMSRRIEQKKYGQIVSESFRVDSVEFSYDDNLLAQFNKFGKTNNKVFHNDLKVRITYLRADLSIQKIEVARDN